MLYINGELRSKSSDQLESATVVQTPVAATSQTNNNSSSTSKFVIGCTASQSACLIVYLMMVEVVVGLQDMRAMIEFAPPLLNNKFLVTASSAFDGSAFQRRLRKTDSVEESRGSLLFDGVHGFMTDLGTYAGMKTVCELFQLTFYITDSFIHLTLLYIKGAVGKV